MFMAQKGLTESDILTAKDRIAAAVEYVKKLRNGFILPHKEPVTFFSLPYQTTVVSDIIKTAKNVCAKCENFVVLGIGGSALGNIALQNALNHPYYNLLSKKERKGKPRLFVLDNIDPVIIDRLDDVIDLKKTVFNVITKSGSTAETMSQFLLFRDKLIRKLGKNKYASHIIATTDIKKGVLRKIADEEGYKTFIVPDGVGGRFSVMSAVGLLSAAVTGINIRKLLDGARDMDTELKAYDDIEKNHALRGAVLLYLMEQKFRRTITVMMPYANSLYSVADWFRQLWAESLGKNVTLDGKSANIGLTPVKALGATDQHSQVQLYNEGPDDKVFIFLRVEKFGSTLKIPKAFSNLDDLGYLGGHTFNELLDAEEKATEAAIAKNGKPSYTISLPKVDAYTIGQLLYLLEVQTAYMGGLYNINAFDQPGVEQGKKFAYGLMGRKGFEHMAEEYRKITGE
jgi:glucose-6-phosphate isomerase